jgi:hypothetical protein
MSGSPVSWKIFAYKFIIQIVLCSIIIIITNIYDKKVKVKVVPVLN